LVALRFATTISEQLLKEACFSRDARLASGINFRALPLVELEKLFGLLVNQRGEKRDRPEDHNDVAAEFEEGEEDAEGASPWRQHAVYAAKWLPIISIWGNHTSCSLSVDCYVCGEEGDPDAEVQNCHICQWRVAHRKCLVGKKDEVADEWACFVCARQQLSYRDRRVGTTDFPSGAWTHRVSRAEESGNWEY
jgi:hypothetical protein